MESQIPLAVEEDEATTTKDFIFFIIQRHTEECKGAEQCKQTTRHLLCAQGPLVFNNRTRMSLSNTKSSYLVRNNRCKVQRLSYHTLLGMLRKNPVVRRQ